LRRTPGERSETRGTRELNWCRFAGDDEKKTWMAGTSPAMTRKEKRAQDR
jgi:hypothetical protein